MGALAKRGALIAMLAEAIATLIAPQAAPAQTLASDFTNATRYDLQRRAVGTIEADPDGAGPLHYAATRSTYDAAGNVIRVEKGELASWQSEAVAPAAWTGFTVFSKVETSYDALDRKVAEVVWGWNSATSAWVEDGVTQYSYDQVGRLDCTALRMNPATWSALPGSACSLATTSATYGPDRITKNIYDDAGQLLKVVKAYGVAGLQQDYATYSYTDNGKQKTIADANGNKSTYSYDGYDRLVAWAFPSKTTTGSSAACTIGTVVEAADGFGNPVVGPSETRAAGDDCEKYAYDRNGNRAKLIKRDGNVIRYAFDMLNRNTVKDIPGGTVADVYFGYDLGGSQLFARFVSGTGAGITNIYDGFGQLASTTNNMGFAPLTLGYQYDRDGSRSRITYPDGTYFSYDYDGLDRVTAIKANSLETIATIAYDNQGRRLADTRGGAVTSYNYDAVSRLANLSNDLSGSINDVTTTFGYNPASQIVTKTRSNDAYGFTGYVNVPGRVYANNGLNQYTAAGSVSFTYDDNGNLTGDGTRTYAYDVENRMVSATTPDGTTTLVYDPLGRLWQQVRPAGGGAAWQFLHDGDDIVERYNYYLTGQSLNTRYVHGPGVDDPLVWYISPDFSSALGLQADYQGSIVSSADASGNLTGINAYDEYGIETSAFTGSPALPLFGYTGQVWLPAIGLNYYKARMYSPTLGRFLQTDPIGYKDQANLYAYAGNDPINGSDPSGMALAIMGGCPAGSVCTSTDPDASNASYEAQFATSKRPPAQQLAGPGSEEEEPPGRINILGFELDPLSGVRQDLFGSASRQLSELEPANPVNTFVRDPNVAPSWQSVFRMQDALRAAQQRAAQQPWAMSVIKANPSGMAALNRAFGSGPAQSWEAIRSNAPRPEGVSNELLRAYQLRLQRQALTGRDSRSGVGTFYPRSVLIARWLRR